MRYCFSIYILFLTLHLNAQEDTLRLMCKCQVDKESKLTICTIVDRPPEFPGGKDSLDRFIDKNLFLPNYESDSLRGIVFISVIVETNGDLMNKRILRGINDLVDKEALRIIDKMPKWVPGKCDGQVVAVEYCIPIKVKKRKRNNAL